MEFDRLRRRSPPLLPQEEINSLTLEFKDREWKFLTSLSPDYTRFLGDENEPFDPSLYTHYGEFFLTLSGIKPCLLITSHGHPSYSEDLYEHVLLPVLEKLKGCGGFDLYKVNNGASSPSSSNQVVYIFTSRFHPKFYLIEELFMRPQRSPTPIPAELLCKALGYPVPNGPTTYCYVDVTTTKELGMNCLTVFEFTAREGFEYSIKMHFEKCAAEFKKLGKVLTMIIQ